MRCVLIFTDETVTNGTIAATVKVLGITIINKEFNLCTELEKLNQKCPLEANNDAKVSITEDLPNIPFKVTMHCIVTNSTCPFTLHVGTGQNRTVPHFMIKVATQPKRAGSGPPIWLACCDGAVQLNQFSCSTVQLRSYCQRFTTGPARFSSVLPHSVNVIYNIIVSMWCMCSFLANVRPSCIFLAHKTYTMPNPVQHALTRLT